MKVKVIHKNKTGNVRQGYSQTGSIFDTKDAVAPTLDLANGRLFKIPEGEQMKEKSDWRTKKKKRKSGLNIEFANKEKAKIQIADYRNDEGLRIRKDGNSPTLAASHNSEGNKDISMCPPLVMNTLTDILGNHVGSSSEFLDSVEKIREVLKKTRRLTPTECERLQGFPDGWTSVGIDDDGKEVLISNTQRYKTLGNAVTTNVIEAIIDKMFFGEKYFNKKYNIKIIKVNKFW